MSGSRKVRSFTEDRWVIGSVVLILSGIILGVLLAEPRAFGITALTVTGLQLILWSVTRSPLLSWLLVLGLVAGVLEPCGLLPFGRIYQLLRLPTPRLTLLYAYRLVAARRPVRSQRPPTPHCADQHRVD
jgi:hypothetical protein